MLTKDEILAREVPAPVPVNAFGGVFVRMMSGTERDAFEEQCTNAKEQTGSVAGFRGRLAVFTVCDAEGHLVFTRNDAAKVGDLPAVDLDRVYEAAAPLNGLTDADVEELVGNSDAGQSGDSG